MPNNNDNNLPSKLFSTMLDKHLGNEIDNSKIQSLMSDDKFKSLNYEILYKFMESAVEEFILLNNGNPLVIKAMVLGDEPTDFEVAVRVARRVFKWNDSALAFAASSDTSRALFVEYIKQEIRGGVV